MTINSNKKHNLLHRIWKARYGYLFILPLMLGLAVFSYYPAFSAIYHSFFDWDSAGDSIFVGLGNFVELWQDKVFLESFITMIIIQIPKLLIGIFFPLIMAELIFNLKSNKSQYWYRILILLPIVTPAIVGTLIWKFVYDPNNGLMTALSRTLGLLSENGVIDWLGDPNWVVFSIIFMGFPWIGGTSVLIYMSGLMDIPTEVLESSRLDGCNTIRRIISIDLPSILGQVRYFLITGIIGALQDYSIQLMLTDGGPGYSTMVPGYYMYVEAFRANRMGYACSIGTSLFLIVFVLTILTRKFVNNKD
ncbi:MAG: sugar ABC transporter permease [Prolixibacteraceae bacterium]|nr:sugar ABC transporter permease [Prolixibacteraceae bacterium]